MLYFISPCFWINSFLSLPKKIEEYKECKSIKGRFQQYFVNGDILDCSSWIQDINDCINFEEKGDYNAAKRIIEHESERRNERMKDHMGNDVWQKRKAPPEDWNKPLPEYISKRYENSYLEVKSRESKGETSPDISIKEPVYCSIM